MWRPTFSSYLLTYRYDPLPIECTTDVISMIPKLSLPLGPAPSLLVLGLMNGTAIT